MAPTPLAEALRQRVRALAAEAEALLSGDALLSEDARGGEPLLSAPPLGFRQEVILPDAPSPEDLSRRLGEIGADAAPTRRLARHIAMTGAGAGRSRPLTMGEAEDVWPRATRKRLMARAVG